MEALTRLASGTLTRMNRAVLAGCLHAHDYGMLPSGVEAAAMAVRLHTRINPQHVVIKTDIKNAFNAINRASIVVAVKKHPQLLPLHAMINTLYGDSSTVTYERRDDSPVVIDAEEGVVQGEPMASALFDITYSDILAPLRARAAETGCVIITIHDDTYIVGPPEAAFELYDQLRPALAPHGLVEQPNKGLAFSRTTDDTLINLDMGGGAGHFIPGTVNALASLREFALSADGLIVGGVPVGTDAFERSYVSGEVDKSVAALRDLQSAALDISLPLTMPKVQGIFNCGAASRRASTFSCGLSTHVSPPRLRCVSTRPSTAPSSACCVSTCTTPPCATRRPTTAAYCARASSCPSTRAAWASRRLSRCATPRTWAPGVQPASTLSGSSTSPTTRPPTLICCRASRQLSTSSGLWPSTPPPASQPP